MNISYQLVPLNLTEGFYPVPVLLCNRRNDGFGVRRNAHRIYHSSLRVIH